MVLEKTLESPLDCKDPPPGGLPDPGISLEGMTPFALGHGVYFFGGIQRSSVDGCSAVSCNFGVLTGEDERMSFYTTISGAFSS